MQELSEKDGKLEIGQDGMKHMLEEAAQYFRKVILSDGELLKKAIR